MPASAFPYFLQEDLGVHGMMHYCRYSNGQIYSFNAYQVCSPSIGDSAPGLGQGMGFLQGQYMDGITKVCVYNVLGQTRALRISGASLCPLNPNF
jgi:hypothetical protein